MLRDTYETDRLLLRLCEPSLAAAVADYYRRNKEFLQASEPEREEAFFTEKYHRKELALYREDQLHGYGVRFWIEKKDGPGRLIGTTALSNIVMGPFCSCFLAYKLDKDELRKGYAAEAVRRLTEIAFDELGLHRIEANIMPRNKASLGLAQKLGFRNEGLSPKYLRINGVWEDHIHMVLRNKKME